MFNTKHGLIFMPTFFLTKIYHFLKLNIISFWNEVFHFLEQSVAVFETECFTFWDRVLQFLERSVTSFWNKMYLHRYIKSFIIWVQHFIYCPLVRWWDVGLRANKTLRWTAYVFLCVHLRRAPAILSSVSSTEGKSCSTGEFFEILWHIISATVVPP